MRNRCEFIKADNAELLNVKINEFFKGLEGEWTITDRIIQQVVETREHYTNEDQIKYDNYSGYWVCFIFYV